MATKLSNIMFILEKVKGQLCMTPEGEIFKVNGWEVKEGTTTEAIKGFFGKKVTEKTPSYVSLVQSVWTKHLGTDYANHKEMSSIFENEAYVNNLYSCRERYLKVKSELDQFGLEIAQKAQAKLKARVDEAIANGASAAEVGKIVGEELGIV